MNESIYCLGKQIYVTHDNGIESINLPRVRLVCFSQICRHHLLHFTLFTQKKRLRLNTLSKFFKQHIETNINVKFWAIGNIQWS